MGLLSFRNRRSRFAPTSVLGAPKSPLPVGRKPRFFACRLKPHFSPRLASWILGPPKNTGQMRRYALIAQGARRGMAGLPVTGVTGQNTLKIDLGDFRPAGRRGPRPPSMLISFAIFWALWLPPLRRRPPGLKPAYRDGLPFAAAQRCCLISGARFLLAERVSALSSCLPQHVFLQRW